MSLKIFKTTESGKNWGVSHQQAIEEDERIILTSTKEFAQSNNLSYTKENELMVLNAIREAKVRQMADIVGNTGYVWDIAKQWFKDNENQLKGISKEQVIIQAMKYLASVINSNIVGSGLLIEKSKRRTL